MRNKCFLNWIHNNSISFYNRNCDNKYETLINFAIMKCVLLDKKLNPIKFNKSRWYINLFISKQQSENSRKSVVSNIADQSNNRHGKDSSQRDMLQDWKPGLVHGPGGATGHHVLEGGLGSLGYYGIFFCRLQFILVKLINQ